MQLLKEVKMTPQEIIEKGIPFERIKEFEKVGDLKDYCKELGMNED